MGYSLGLLDRLFATPRLQYRALGVLAGTAFAIGALVDPGLYLPSAVEYVLLSLLVGGFFTVAAMTLRADVSESVLATAWFAVLLVGTVWQTHLSVIQNLSAPVTLQGFVCVTAACATLRDKRNLRNYLIVTFLSTLGMPFVLFTAGIDTFFLIGVGGFSVIDRYLMVAAVMLLIFAAFLLTGWTMLPSGRLRRIWSLVAVVAAVGVVVVAVDRVQPGSIDNDLTFRGQAHEDLVTVLNDPDVRAALPCGPVWTPNHKLVPDVRWIIDAPASKVIPVPPHCSVAISSFRGRPTIPSAGLPTSSAKRSLISRTRPSTPTSAIPLARVAPI